MQYVMTGFTDELEKVAISAVAKRMLTGAGIGGATGAAYGGAREKGSAIKSGLTGALLGAAAGGGYHMHRAGMGPRKAMEESMKALKESYRKAVAAGSAEKEKIREKIVSLREKMRPAQKRKARIEIPY